jgi:hypothetical protein
MLWVVLIVMMFAFMSGGCGGGGGGSGASYGNVDSGSGTTDPADADVFNGSWRCDDLTFYDGDSYKLTGYLTVTPVSNNSAANTTTKSLSLDVYYMGYSLDDPLELDNISYNVSSSYPTSITISVSESSSTIKMTYYYSSSTLSLSMQTPGASLNGSFVQIQKSANMPTSRTTTSESDLENSIKNLINTLKDKVRD